MPEEDYKLCYVDGPWAYFTTCPLDKQWGDDWDDAPYEHNAGRPYKWDEHCDVPRYEIIKIAFNAPLDRPGAWQTSSSYSVQQINAGVVAWLSTDRWYKGKPVAIYAGVSLPEFIRLIKEVGGKVYREI